MTRQLIAEGWESYRRAVLREDLAPLVRRRLRAVFYAGATHLFSALVEMGNPSNGDNAEQVDALQREILAYIAEERAQSEKVQ